MTRWQFVVVFMALMLASGAVRAQGELLKRGDKQYELGNFAGAIEAYNDYLKAVPSGDKDMLVKLADSYQRLNLLEDSANTFKKATQLSGVNGRYVLEYANVLKSLGKYDAAKTWYEIYAQAEPQIGKHFIESCDYAIADAALPSLYRIGLEFANTEFSDFSPAFYKGNQLVYASSRGDLVPKGKVAPKDNLTKQNFNFLFVSKIDKNGFLTQPLPFHGAIKENYNEGPLSFSSDGKWVAFTKNSFINGTRHVLSGPNIKLDMFIAKVSDKGEWIEAQAFPFNNQGYSTGYPSLSDDGNTLYFSSDMPNGFGGFDIYVSHRMADAWSTPENLGNIVNTPGDEISPCFAADVLYFSSNWHKGFGGMDVFKSPLHNGKFDAVIQMGTGINSSYDDYGLIAKTDSPVMYFVSNRPKGKGLEDIYQAEKLAHDLTINTLNKSDLSPLQGVTLDFSGCGLGKFATNAKGQYALGVMPGTVCEVVASKAGYGRQRFTIDAATPGASLQVLLERTGNEYMGKVLEAGSGSPLGNVLVRSTNQKSGQKSEAMTDDNGQYFMDLDKNQRYIIKFSKAGMVESSRIVSTENGSDRNVLGVSEMASISSVKVDFPVSMETPMPALDAEDGAPKEGVPVAVAPVKKEKKATAKPVEAKKSTKTLASATKGGYAVQVASVSVANRKIPSQFLKLEGLGELYSIEDNKWARYRVGVFADRADAVLTADAIKAQGFDDAFVVAESAENLDKRDVIVGFDAKSGETAMENRAATAAATAPSTANVAPSGGYKVQLAVVKNTANFSPKGLELYGTVEQLKRPDGMTVLLLGDIASLEAAQKIAAIANQMGYNGAFAVKQQNGEITRVR